MGTPFRIEPGVTLRAASVARDQSETVTSQLEAIDRDVEDLLSTWRGDAARAYGESWADLLELLRTAASDLDRLGAHLHDSTHSFVAADDGE